MANLSMQGRFSQHEIYEQKYHRSRVNLLLVVVFTAINLLLLVTNADSYFLFSAFIPYFIATIGMLLCGRFPEEYYTEELEGMAFLDNSVFVILLVVAVVLTLLYLLAWFMSSKNRVGWLIFALVFFGLDTIGLLLIGGISLDSVFDIVFHGWAIYDLILGVRAHYKWKKLPPEEEPVVAEGENPEEGATETSDSAILREAAKDVKHRVLLETRMFNYDICYRRVKHTNELVINGNVYDEYAGTIEPPHTLSAMVGGHYIEVGYTGSHSFISVDGQNVIKKLRLF